MTLGVVYFKKPRYGWYMVLGEILLGGSGHYLEFFGLSVRTVFIHTFLFLWIVHSFGDKTIRPRLHIPHRLFFFLIPIFFFAIVSTILGIVNGHTIQHIFQDALPFSFLLLLLPAYEEVKSEQTQAYLARLLAVFLIGGAIISLSAFLWYSADIGSVHDGFYTWFRDSALGKITYIGSDFFRIVLPEHILVVPLVLLISSLLMRNESHNQYWRLMVGAGLLTMALNMSRTYMVALVVGFIVLKWKHLWRRWIPVTIGALAMLAIFLTSLSFGASGEKTFGWEMIGGRFLSIVHPSTEISTYTRMSLFKPIFHVIQAHPLIGSGFGQTISFYVPSLAQTLTSTNFGWGYLEMWAKLGFFGLASFMLAVVFLLYDISYSVISLSDYQDFYVGVLAGVVALLVINVTDPALFQTFGLLYLIFAIVVASKPIHSFERVLIVLYRMFNHLQKPIS